MLSPEYSAIRRSNASTVLSNVTVTLLVPAPAERMFWA